MATHLTETGFNAGALLCGRRRDAVRLAGDATVHAIYSDRVKGAICPDCAAIWGAIDGTDEEYARVLAEHRAK